MCCSRGREEPAAQGGQTIKVDTGWQVHLYSMAKASCGQTPKFIWLEVYFTSREEWNEWLGQEGNKVIVENGLSQWLGQLRTPERKECQ